MAAPLRFLYPLLGQQQQQQGTAPTVPNVSIIDVLEKMLKPKGDEAPLSKPDALSAANWQDF